MLNRTIPPAVAGLLLVGGAADALTLNKFLVSDQTRDQVLLSQDLNGDGDTNDPGEVTVFYDSSNAGGGGTTTNVFSLTQAKDGSVFVGDGDSDSVHVVRDNDGDGNAQGAGESRLWFSGTANASGFNLNTPNGIAEGPDGAIYITEADTNGTPTGDWVYRTVDLNGDGDANDAGEATKWLDLSAVNPDSVPFEIVFDGSRAYISDLAGTSPDVVRSAEDLNGDGVIGSGEIRTFYSDGSGVGGNTDIAIDVGAGSLWSWQWIPEDGLSSLFRMTDLDGSGIIDSASEIVEVWNTDVLSAPYEFLAGFSLNFIERTGELLLTSNAGSAAGDWVISLLDRDGDGTFFDTDDWSFVLTGLDSGGEIVRPREVIGYADPTPVPLPPAMPLAAAGFGLLALVRRRRS